MKQPLIWTGGPLEFTGSRGKLTVAKIVRDVVTRTGYEYSLYDQRDTSEGLGSLQATGISLEEAKRRAEEL